MNASTWPTIESYEQALQFVYGRIDYERLQTRDYSADDLKLERMRQLLAVLGNPQERIPTIHVAGTKGKGSTCEMIASILNAAGIATGLYTSPHISRFEERIRIGGIPLSRSELVDQLRQLLSAFESTGEKELVENATFFELTTALAWQAFSANAVDFVVLEVGLGGRLDCTNICAPCLTVITRIGLDHTQVLGKTISKIASEKAGIIKPGIPIVSSPQEPDAQEVITQTASRNDSPLHIVRRDIQYTRHVERPSNQQRIDVSLGETSFNGIPVPLPGKHQCENAAVAIASVALSPGLETIGKEEIQQGMSHVQLPLRMELMGESPRIILDAAHNPTAIRALVGTLNESFTDCHRILIFGSSRDKDVAGMAESLANEFSTIIVAEYQTNPRSKTAEELQSLFATINPAAELHCIPNPADALRHARSIADAETLICVTGSFFLAAELRELLLSEK